MLCVCGCVCVCVLCVCGVCVHDWQEKRRSINGEDKEIVLK